MKQSPEETGRLDAEMLAYLRIGGSEVAFAAGETAVHKGDRGIAVYLVLDGEVEVALPAADGRSLALTRLGPGELFGELSLLRDEPVSADVTFTAPGRLLRYPAELFTTALAECAPFREKVLGHLAGTLRRSTNDAWSLFKRQQAFSDLSLVEGAEETMVVASARMRAVKKKLEALGEHPGSVLITGAPGTGRTLAARLVHRSADKPDRPMILVDCAELPAERAHTALFGNSSDGLSPAEGDNLGALHLALGGDLILSNVGALAAAEQEKIAGFLRHERERAGVSPPRVRIVATAHDVDDPHYGGEVVEALRAKLEHVVRLPKLANRPRDIVPLARHFLSKLEGGGHRQFSPDAERALVSLRYPVRNVDELRDLVELAAHYSKDNEIRAEHIFLGIRDEEPFGMALGRPPLLMRLLGGGGISFLRTVTLLGFAAVIGLCVTAGASQTSRIANGFIWSVWEPAVFGLFLLGGALWCTVCPLSTAAQLAKKVFSLGRPTPRWLTGTLAGGLPALGFFSILFVEHRFDMTTVALGSGLLLLTLLLASVVLGVAFEREVWCRYVCPLGRLAVIFAPAAPLSVAADRTICSSTCTSHACFRGSDGVAGCPVFHHPLSTSEAHYCKLCANCLQSCPHESANLYLRPPGQGAWRLSGAGSYPSAFAVTLLLLAPLFLAAQTTETLERPAVLLGAGLASVFVGLALGGRLPQLLGEGQENQASAQSVAAALAVLAWGPLMAGQFHNIPVLADLRLQSASGARWLGPLAGEGMTVLTLACVTVVLFAGLGAAVVLWNASRRSARDSASIPKPAWRFLAAVWCLVVGLSLVLVLQ